jgi:septum formation protein
MIEEPLIVLASTSRHRRALLESVGIPHTAVSPDFDEDHALPLTPEQLVVTFARGKAESLGARHPKSLIVGGDQAVELDGRVLTKPGTRERAIEQLGHLAGRTHRLLTAIALHDPARARTEHRLVIHEMRMRRLSRAIIEAYVDRESPLDCAGAFKIESLGVLLFEEMRGPDHTAIVGLPLAALGDLLLEAGVDLAAVALGLHVRTV